MKIGNIFNEDRVNALRVDNNAYNSAYSSKIKEGKVRTQTMEKVLFSEPYENASPYYSRQNFSRPQPPETPQQNQSQSQQNTNQMHQNNMQSMFNMQSLLPMLMGGKFNDMLKPLMSIFGGGNGGGGMDIAKIFELFKPKSKPQKKEDDKEDVSSKFDDFIIIED